MSQENPFEAKRQFNQMIGNTNTEKEAIDNLRQRLEELKNQPQPVLELADPFDIITYDLDEEDLPMV
jgi:FPC/CPF motif-containing protein YcgG